MITYGAGAGVIDLGNDPPLVVGEEHDNDAAHVRRAVSWRWMGYGSRQLKPAPTVVL